MLYLDIVFIIVFSLYLYWIYGLLRALKSDTPYVPIQTAVLDRMIEFAASKPGDLWVDLGSGDGRVLIAACKKYGVRGVGIERIGALRWYARFKIVSSGLLGKIKIVGGDFFAADLSKADVVSFYLLPITSEKIIQKLRKEMKPGAHIVYHRYPIPGVTPARIDAEYKVYWAKMPF